MRAAVITEPMKVEILDVPVPVIKPDEVLIKVKSVGLCGTDIHIVEGVYSPEYPRIPGHEFSGKVEEVGGDVTGFSIGDRVTVDPIISCGACYFCKRGQLAHCENLKIVGVNSDGAFADYVAIPFSNVFRIGDSIRFEEAAFTEPLACVTHGINHMDVKLGSEMLIVGAGPIGLLLLQSARLYGTSNLVIIDKDEEKLGMAKSFGADHAVLATDHTAYELLKISKRGFDYVIDATGIPSVIENTVEYLKRGGTYLIFGVCPMDSKISISPYKVLFNDWKILGSYMARGAFSLALNMLESGRIKTEGLISIKGSIDDFPELIQMKMHQKNLMKVQVEFK